MDAINECFLRCLLARAQMDGSPPEVDVCLGRLEELVASHNYRPTAWCERVQGLKSAVSVFSTASSKPLLICLQYRVDQLLLQVTMQRLLAHPKQQRFLPPIGIPTKNLVVTS